MELNVIADHSSFAVVEKPAGVLSTPGRNPEDINMVSLFRKRFPGTIIHPEVHRLDMATSGLMVMAKNQRAHRTLSIQFINRVVQKRYEALLEGVVEELSGRIKLAFRLDENNRPLQIYDPKNGKMGETLWERISVDNGITRVSFKPITGRTHQLRLHASHVLGLNAPIVGDSFYGTGTSCKGLKLHAAEISFLHPETEKPLKFSSSVPF